ncbi:flagellar hook-basal body complex protein [Alphaproteobacteria bacterium]|nr:flagellar hook-basal body complex protein [Alphaproteobacteria bacterium]
MSLFGAIAAGITGLDSNAQALGSISANISNLNTVGYKRNETRFQTLVSPGQGGFSQPSGVLPSVRNLVDQQGLMQTSSNSTHLGINGEGFFVVADIFNPTNTTGTFQFTRAGQFEANKDGNLVNTSGFFLRGWAIDESTGAITDDRGSLTATETVNVADIAGTATATANVNLEMNLNSQEAVTSAPTLTSIFAADTGKTITGNSNLDGTDLTAATRLANGDTITITVQHAAGTLTGGGGSLTGDAQTSGAITFTFNTTPVATSNQFRTLNQLKALIDSNVGMNATVNGGVLTLTGDPRSELVLAETGDGDHVFGAAGTTADTYEPTSSALNMASGAITPSFKRSVQIFDSKGAAHTLSLAFLKSNHANTYYAEIFMEPSGDTSNAVVDGIIAHGRIRFNTDGTIDTGGTDAALRGVLNGGTDLTINYSTAQGSTTPQTIKLGIGTNGKADGITQFAAASNLKEFTVDGAIFGQLASISVNDKGVLTALFDNGTSRDLYKLPIATFTNANGLDPSNKNTYIQTTTSGSFNLKEAGDGAGSVSPASFEASTVDLADEFTDMIITQQAFSANGKVVSVGTDLLDEVIRLIR